MSEEHLVRMKHSKCLVKYAWDPPSEENIICLFFISPRNWLYILRESFSFQIYTIQFVDAWRLSEESFVSESGLFATRCSCCRYIEQYNHGSTHSALSPVLTSKLTYFQTIWGWKQNFLPFWNIFNNSWKLFMAP